MKDEGKMKKELVRLMVIGCIGIISFIGVKESKTNELYDVEIIHISQIEKAQEQQNKFSDKDMVLFLGWIFSL